MELLLIENSISCPLLGKIPLGEVGMLERSAVCPGALWRSHCTELAPLCFHHLISTEMTAPSLLPKTGSVPAAGMRDSECGEHSGH